MKLKWLFLPLILIMNSIGANASGWNMDTGVDACLPVLAKDYYHYASSKSLKIDYIKTIDSETWSELKSDGGFSLDIDGLSMGSTYDEFSSNRTKYLERIGYNRSEQQARDIIQITTSDRAFTAYGECLRTIGSGSPIRVWAVHETMDTIILRVKYFNPPGVKSKRLLGSVQGGSVEEAKSGKIWNRSKKWKIMQEKSFVIHRTAGTAETVVTVAAKDGTASAITLNFKRADATITQEYAGSREIHIGRVSKAAGTPNNDYRACNSGCAACNHGYCESRTDISLSVSPPFSLKNASTFCSGSGCGWTSGGAVSYSDSNRTASSFFHNWSVNVTFTLAADKYETIGKTYCGQDITIPVLDGTTNVFHSTKECLPLAVLKWKKLTGVGESGIIKFGDQGSEGDTLTKVGTDVDSGTAISVTYKYSAGSKENGTAPVYDYDMKPPIKSGSPVPML